jgi:ABC-type multidrug transport system fused ATPase/permease subunit
MLRLVVARATAALFNDGIGNNIALGKPEASQGAVEKAAQATRLRVPS